MGGWLGLSVLWALPLSAATLRVPQDQPNLAAAVAAASPGDEIAVAAGTYSGAGNEDVVVASNLLLRGEAGAAQTHWSCGAAGVSALLVTGGSVLVDGFSFSGCDNTDGGAISVTGGSLSLVNSEFSGN